MNHPPRTLGLFLAVCALACHPRNDVVPERDPPCMGASVTRLLHHVHEGTLVVEQRVERLCPSPGEQASTVEPVATVPISAQRGCPSGEPALQVGPERTLVELPGISRALLEHVTRALRNFSTVHGKGSGLAFVLSCEARPRWLFVTTDTGQPVTSEFSEAAPPVPPREPPVEVTKGDLLEPRTATVRTGACEEQLTLDGGVLWRGRLLTTGGMPGPSRMTQWLLGRARDRAELIVQELETVEDKRADEQPQGPWQCTSSSAWEGRVTGERRLTFRLEQPPSGASRSLVCQVKSMRVADADARRVRVSRPAPGEGCNASRWSARRKTALQVLACDDGENEVPFFLAAGAGVERVRHDEDVLYDEPSCTGTPPALRRAPPDGGVTTAILQSERP